MEIGERIRALRKEHGLTLEELSERSGLAMATLSRLENGKGSGTFRTHQKIAEALGLVITELYRGYERFDEEAVLFPPEREVEEFSYDTKVTSVFLTSQIYSKRMLPQILALQPGGRTTVEQHRKGTERWIFGLEGEVQIKVADKLYRIHRGSALYLKASLPHRFANVTRKVARCIMVTTPVVL